MKRLQFPVALDYTEQIIGFGAGHPELAVLGEPGFIESDGMRTAGGRELYWAYEWDDGLRLQLTFYEPINQVSVAVDPPDAQRGLAALRSLGLDREFEVYPAPKTKQERPLRECRLVWAFTGTGSRLPTGLFSSRSAAEKLIAKKGYSGVLVPYPLDYFLYDVLRNFDSSAANQLTPEQAQAYTGDSDDQTEFFRGARVPYGAVWQVWRKDEQGQASAISSHATRAEAETARVLIERAVPDRTHWVQPVPPQPATTTPPG